MATTYSLKFEHSQYFLKIIFLVDCKIKLDT